MSTILIAILSIIGLLVLHEFGHFIFCIKINLSQRDPSAKLPRLTRSQLKEVR